MKAPDKIFLRETTRVNDTWYQKPSNLCQNHEYIRKEAILEWAKEIAENASWVSIDAVVNKIESL